MGTPTNSPISVSGGNVGIGTTSPIGPLEVYGGGFFNFSNAFFAIQTSAPATTAFGQSASDYFNNFNNNAGILIRKAGTGSGDYLDLEGSSNNPIFIVKSSGNVGIGTTTPGQTLAVNGNIGMPNINAQRVFSFTASGDANTDLWFASNTPYANNAAYAGLYLARLHHTAAGSGNDLNDLVGLHINGYYSDSGFGVPLYLGGYNYGSENPALTITASSKVGIGTTVPQYLLDVAGPIRSSAGGVVFPDGTTQTTAYTQIASGQNVITEANGFVGVGTTAPLSPLSVSGQVVIGTPYKGDASLQINAEYGCCGRLTEISPGQASQNALNLMASLDNTGAGQ